METPRAVRPVILPGAARPVTRRVPVTRQVLVTLPEAVLPVIRQDIRREVLVIRPAPPGTRPRPEVLRRATTITLRGGPDILRSPSPLRGPGLRQVPDILRGPDTPQAALPVTRQTQDIRRDLVILRAVIPVTLQARVATRALILPLTLEDILRAPVTRAAHR